MITNVTKDNFQNEVTESSIPVLLDFWAPWCGYCINLGPVIDEIAEEMEGKLKVCKINIDEEPELAMEYGVLSIPTCAKFENGKLVNKVLGALPKDQLISDLNL